jgi:hypothetical protein
MRAHLNPLIVKKLLNGTVYVPWSFPLSESIYFTTITLQQGLAFSHAG